MILHENPAIKVVEILGIVVSLTGVILAVYFLIKKDSKTDMPY